MKHGESDRVNATATDDVPPTRTAPSDAADPGTSGPVRLWYLEAIEGAPAFDPWYNKAFAHVVRAGTEERARVLASMEGGDEVKFEPGHPKRIRSSPWTDPKQTTCRP